MAVEKSVWQQSTSFEFCSDLTTRYLEFVALTYPDSTQIAHPDLVDEFTNGQ
ncbi:phosphotransferase enzyme family protein [Corchorus olitorius]|uniref:Phosphotransferase enzyme family protein n=1 Tax=Corchorus olitorius TaxID=93759 RepID=A0A1R3HQR8_9ROSI|nr:phosphotransferase enzyme family protein [Corchorus olitorius]